MPNNSALEDYKSRINRVSDYIEKHLDTELNLKELAGVAHFSPYHFHRIFKAMVGETLHGFIQRLRVEKAANQLIVNPKKTITEIALDCGFGSSAHFARAFKENYGISASDWRNGEYSNRSKTQSKNHQMVSKLMKELYDIGSYLDPVTNNMKWRIKMNVSKKLTADVEIRDLPETNVIYIRHVGPYKADEALFTRLFGQLIAWAEPRGLFNPPETKSYSIYHDDPSITEEEKLRLSVCFSVPGEVEVDGEIGKMTLPAGKCAVAKFEITADQYGDAWDAVYSGWFPQSGYQPDDRPCFEHYLNNPKEHPEGKHIVEIWAPVKPL